MRDKEFLDLANAYQLICEQQIGVPIPKGKTPEDVLKDLLPDREKKNVMPPSKMVRTAEEVDIFDQVLQSLLDEGYTEDESMHIMTYIVEQGINPTGVFLYGLKDLLFPRNKPQPFQAPKPPNPPKIKPAQKAPTVSRPTLKPGESLTHTIRATGPSGPYPGLDKYKPTDVGRSLKPTSKPGFRPGLADVLYGVSQLQGSTPQSGPAQRRMQSLRAAKSNQYGRYAPAPYSLKPQGPRNPDEGLTRAQSFDKAYKKAKETGGMGSTFTWRDKSYKVA